jgi:hypothetical protein
MPKGFVRLVYALGYGGNCLLDEPIVSPRNSGTPQYWKIFRSCATVPGVLPNFADLQISRTHDSHSRVRAKIKLLSVLQERGIWLVDASVAALYRPGQPALTPREKGVVLQTSSDAYTHAVLEAAEPEAVLCIGIGVVRALRTRLDINEEQREACSEESANADIPDRHDNLSSGSRTQPSRPEAA